MLPLLEEARRQHVRLLYWFVDPADTEAAVTARALGARLADRKITYCIPTDSAPQQLAEGIEPITVVTPQLRSLALQSGCCSRFLTDPGFAAGVYEELYTRWIENSVTGDRAREVLVYRPAPTAPEMGLLTLEVHHDLINIGLLAVDEMARGQKVGTKLVAAARQRTAQWGFPTLQVVTQQDNLNACRFYEQCGFHAERIQHVYHIWMK
ncbi:GNAT family N-acetyltransferase [Hymenobacter cellulosilyticus]|uniref:GNAT family N-acetyltransferase n=1 Tax=Hymenobacter cellulosilyticus TaxID=2932248 RepID=A0A8T9QBR7_9BACT|nr:GNAT family N-acetyltransferase [Hymenobacter cellulosilyticus]UOQ74432.1 GNAT family N-acetyltransferase [Hymenobacter cellulosilyticus]